MVTCDKKEAMRYLGYHGQEISDNVLKIIDETAAEAEKIVTPRHCISEFEIEKTSDGILINDCGIVLGGTSIQNHLDGCKRIVMLAATIGVEIERRTRIYEAQSMTKAIILDCCASAMIETYCDSICADLSKKVKERNLFTTTRFSPGYGDLPLSLQPDFLRVSNAARRIGLTCNDRFLMFPRKSVTAIIGLCSHNQNCEKNKCSACSMRETCISRKY